MSKRWFRVYVLAGPFCHSFAYRSGASEREGARARQSGKSIGERRFCFFLYDSPAALSAGEQSVWEEKEDQRLEGASDTNEKKNNWQPKHGQD
jgi:hypothetical protein